MKKQLVLVGMKRNHISSIVPGSKNTILKDRIVNDFHVETTAKILFHINTDKHIKEDLIDLWDKVNPLRTLPD
jgi:hypothetical protein